jgi:hypothetical protein
MPRHPDFVWSNRQTAHPLAVYTQPRLNESHEEQLVSQALAASQTPGEVLKAITRPPLPRVQLFPSRLGYRTEQPGIEDVIDVSILYPGARVDYSQSQSGYSGTSYPSLNQF